MDGVSHFHLGLYVYFPLPLKSISQQNFIVIFLSFSVHCCRHFQQIVSHVSIVSGFLSAITFLTDTFDSYLKLFEKLALKKKRSLRLIWKGLACKQKTLESHSKSLSRRMTSPLPSPGYCGKGCEVEGVT